jgi:hypothetical protein
VKVFLLGGQSRKRNSVSQNEYGTSALDVGSPSSPGEVLRTRDKVLTRSIRALAPRAKAIASPCMETRKKFRA